MLSQKTKSFITRLLKGFFFGAISAALVTLGNLPAIPNWTDLGVIAPSLLVGFFTGGLMAVQKMWSWKEGYEIDSLK